MKVSTFGIKVWRWLSVIFVIGALIWTYAVFPEQVAVDFADTGLAIKYLGKEQIFYVVMGLFLVNNVLITGLTRQIPKIDAEQLPIPNRKIWAKFREELDELLVNWVLCLVAVINTIAGFSLLALATVNSHDSKLDVFDFSWIFYAGMALIILVFLLPLRLFWTPTPEDRL